MCSTDWSSQRERRHGSKFSAVTRPVERLIATAQNGLEVLRLGGLETGNSPSPSQVVESVPMYKLRRYFPPDSRPGHPEAGPPVLLVHPMMMSANMFDVTRDEGAVGILHSAGLDPWVIDFGSPDEIEGGMRRTLADHIVALSEALAAALFSTQHDEVIGGLAIVHDAGYIRAETLHIWRQTFLRALAHVFLIVLITLLIVRWSIAGPHRTYGAVDARFADRANLLTPERHRSGSLSSPGAGGRRLRRKP